MIQEKFQETIRKYSDDFQVCENYWNEIVRHYSEKHRFYHDLSHIENLFNLLYQIKDRIEDWDTILFSIVYHDILYDVSSHENEEKSAVIAKDRLQSIGYPKDQIAKCASQIVATKGHSTSEDLDTNLFLDADLSILGEEWNLYSDYCKNIRKEYSIYSDGDYKIGRGKVLKHFLNMERIYKTDFFFERYEKRARENLKRELENL
ncbi:hypothetical protein JWG44_02480 [Leptospira sp. 201903071]|uniref:HD domain-containing protein n=1 Tax=Leptospira ainazelensis TaxID=2810034 RepID=UPI001964BF2E|nr:hypothetical protein [Leptospira ainazelensis]MBM9499120.1 hypothetical protein [Leptospira ainazelensis]